MTPENIYREYIKPSKIFGNLYFIGIRAVCTHLIDTGDGLIIIDPGYSESLPIITDNIYELGFNPNDIRYILVSHAHYDHMNSVSKLAELTKAKTIIGKDDLPLLNGEIFHFPINKFKPDIILEDGDIISLGNTEIKCVSTPGHTDGTMSFFFDVTDGEKTHRAGMFGGAGTNTLIREFLEEHNLPLENRYKFIESIEKLKRETVELFLGNHLENNKTEEKLKNLHDQARNPFIDISGKEWLEFLEERLAKINHIIKENL